MPGWLAQADDWITLLAATVTQLARVRFNSGPSNTFQLARQELRGDAKDSGVPS